MTIEEYKKRYAGKGAGGGTIGHPEEDLQRQCVAWFRERYPGIATLLFHPNNEPFFGYGGKSERQKAIIGKRFKDLGVTAGVADLILLHPSHDGQYHALCIEMKRPGGGTQSESQKAWQKAVEGEGFRYVVCRSIEQFMELIEGHLQLPPMTNEELTRAAIESARASFRERMGVQRSHNGQILTKKKI